MLQYGEITCCNSVTASEWDMIIFHHLGHLGLLNFFLTIQKFSIELRSLFWYRTYHETKLDVLLVNSYEKLLIKLEIKRNFRVFRVFENNL